MKILIACEFSGIVRDAFIEKGHDAMSCDLLPSERAGPHYQGDVMDIIDDGWDMMIAHPPCTYLTTAGNRSFVNNPDRYIKRSESIEFVKKLYNSNIPKVAIENPQGYLNTMWKRPSQCIHPYMFGDNVMKRTCLWLKGLPKLYHTVNNVFHHSEIPPEPLYIRTKGKTKGKKVHFCEMASGKDGKPRWQVRATTFNGIAKAMAEQWG